MILATDGVEVAREALTNLRAQTAAARIEVLLVTPPGDPHEEPVDGLDVFHSVRIIEADTTSSTPRARGIAFAAARAPVVAMTETHCFPEPDWAVALIAAHRGPWAAVGPELHNANPNSLRSWANLIVDYGPWLAPMDPGPVDDLPGHNSAYKRAVLIDEYGDELGRLFESETVLHWELRSRGYGLYLESGARTHHRNHDRPFPAMVEHFNAGRGFGALRSRNWSPARRALYAIASPLIPPIRLRRMLGHIRRTRRRDLLPGVLPMMVGSLVAHAVGEMIGYLSGPGRAAKVTAKYELHRESYVNDVGASVDGDARKAARMG